jgi:hypothetical protein
VDTGIRRESDEGKSNSSYVTELQVKRVWFELHGGFAADVLYFTRALMAAALPDVLDVDDGKLRLKVGEWTETETESMTEIRGELEEFPTIDRQFILKEVLQRIRNAKLRPAVLRYWGTACAACGLELEADGLFECEVAHIHPVHLKGTDQLRNALPLCRTHHWAFDRLLWAIDPETQKISVRQSHQEDPMLAPIDGVKVTAPEAEGIDFLATDVLTHRWERFGEVATSEP